MGLVSYQNEGRSALKNVTDKCTGMRPFAIPTGRWEDSIRLYLEETAINTRSWVDLAHERDYWRALVNAVLNLRVP